MDLQLDDDKQKKMSVPSSSLSRLQSLYDKFHCQIRRIDALEAKMDQRAIQTRRRLANLLDHEASPHPFRQSHLRLFVSHGLVKTQEREDWKLQIEGRLLVDHLDHQSAVEYDKRTNYTPPKDDLDRSKGEQEEEAVAPIMLTHFFDKLTVQFQPIFKPKPNPMSRKYQQQELQSQSLSSSPPKKKLKSSRRGSSTRASPTGMEPGGPASAMLTVGEDDVDPAQLVPGSTTELIWTSNMSRDAHAWQIGLPSPEPPGYHLMLHSIVATIKLYSHRGSTPQEALYQVAPELSSALFPTYGPDNTSTNTTALKKRKAEELSTAEGGDSAATATSNDDPPSTDAEPKAPPKLETEIHIPQGLTLKEIILAFYTYIRDRGLSSKEESDQSLIVCDKKLQSLFRVESFHFHELQRLLLAQNLLIPINKEPVEIVYILKRDTAVPLLRTERPPKSVPSGQDAEATEPQGSTDGEEEEPTHALMQIDMDVAVPSLFPFRVRELLRRIKRRELEYTSSRTKARYMLMARRAKSEDVVKTMIDSAVGGHSLKEELQPVLAALAKAAPPNTEARMAPQYDLRMSYLLSRMKEHQQKALAAWELVDACRQAGKDDKAETKKE